MRALRRNPRPAFRKCVGPSWPPQKDHIYFANTRRKDDKHLLARARFMLRAHVIHEQESRCAQHILRLIFFIART